MDCVDILVVLAMATKIRPFLAGTPVADDFDAFVLGLRERLSRGASAAPVPPAYPALISDAASHPAPQSFYEEDQRGLHGPFVE